MRAIWRELIMEYKIVFTIFVLAAVGTAPLSAQPLELDAAIKSNIRKANLAEKDGPIAYTYSLRVPTNPFRDATQPPSSATVNLWWEGKRVTYEADYDTSTPIVYKSTYQRGDYTAKGELIYWRRARRVGSGTIDGMFSTLDYYQLQYVARDGQVRVQKSNFSRKEEVDKGLLDPVVRPFVMATGLPGFGFTSTERDRLLQDVVLDTLASKQIRWKSPQTHMTGDWVGVLDNDVPIARKITLRAPDGSDTALRVETSGTVSYNNGGIIAGNAVLHEPVVGTSSVEILEANTVSERPEWVDQVQKEVLEARVVSD